MSLSALINGADCGPVNALQGLSKRFDGDRGVAGDQFAAGRAGPSRETFRSQPAHASPALQQEATAFFQGNVPSQAFRSSPFDASSLKHSLAPTPVLTPRPADAAPSWAVDFSASKSLGGALESSSRANVSWANDFVSQSSATMSSTPAPMATMPNQALYQPAPYSMTMPMRPPLLQPQPLPGFALQHEVSAHSNIDIAALESHFSQLDTSSETAPAEIKVDDLAKTAGLLIDALRNENNQKFKQSEFMKLMGQLRDHQMVVDGNDLVQATEASSSASALEMGYDSATAVDVKGKGRAIDPSSSTGRRKSVHFDRETAGSPVALATPEDFEDWDWDAPQSSDSQARRRGIIEAQEAEWAQLRADWDEWSATPVGFQSSREETTSQTRYRFQQNNPFMNAEFVNHRAAELSRASGNVRSIYQSVLEKEAEVQRNPYDASAWLQLGMKQQENEREGQAIVALRRAIELDPTLLPAWLSLAVSHTNEGSRHDAFQALTQWIENNEQYKIITAKYRLSANPDPEKFMSMREKREKLIDCLIDMATSAQTVGISSGVDADVQIALAVLLNTSEEYDKAVDCFKAALEARPDDFSLYNRVGATLANSGRPEDALAYYYRALELNPTYIRARYNLGISCISLRRYEEAASHMLDALVLQENDGTGDQSPLLDGQGPNNYMSSSLWDSLRTICHHMKRVDLAALCERRDLDGFRSVFYTQ